MRRFLRLLRRLFGPPRPSLRPTLKEVFTPALQTARSYSPGARVEADAQLADANQRWLLAHGEPAPGAEYPPEHQRLILLGLLGDFPWFEPQLP